MPKIEYFGDTLVSEESMMESMMGLNIIGVIQVFSPLLYIVGVIVGIMYMKKSKKTKGKRILIGTAIIVAPYILTFILSVVRIIMLSNM